MKYLIVNADDFGYASSINRGIIEAHVNGIVTSTSLMVYGSAANEVKKLKKYPGISIGLHFILPKNKAEIKKEFDKQILKFEELVGKKPTHLDSHKTHPKSEPKLKEVFNKYSKTNNIPIRSMGFAKFIDSFFGFGSSSHGIPRRGNVSVNSLVKAINETEEGFNEIMCHPGYSDNLLKKLTSYNIFREIELKSLTNPKVKEHINKKGIELCNWTKVLQ